MNLVNSIDELCRLSHENSKNKGFWNDNHNNLSEKICLIHSELSEAQDGLRHGNPPDDHIPEFTSLEAELADACIRIFDLSAFTKSRLGLAIQEKMKYNAERPYKHGKIF